VLLYLKKKNKKNKKNRRKIRGKIEENHLIRALSPPAPCSRAPLLGKKIGEKKIGGKNRKQNQGENRGGVKQNVGGNRALIVP
jgi:hypothetical protein